MHEYVLNMNMFCFKYSHVATNLSFVLAIKKSRHDR